MMEVAPAADTWLPLKEIPPGSDGEDEDRSSPITIVAQDYLDDPPVRDIPNSPPKLPPPPPDKQDNILPQPPPVSNPVIDVSQAIAATASAVASSIPLTQLQRSIDTFCSTLIARTENKSQEPAHPDRYALRMIEDLDLIKYQLSRPPAPPPPPAPAPPSEQQRVLLTEFQSEVRQLKLRLEEQSSLARIYAPLTDIQHQISSLKTALTDRNTFPPPPNHSTATPTPTSILIHKQCQTQATIQPDTVRIPSSVSIQTSPPRVNFHSPHPRKLIPSPILSSSPLSHPLPPPPLPPSLRLSHIESKLRHIQLSKKQIELSSRRFTHSLPLTEIVQQVLNREEDEFTSRAHQLVSDKLESIKYPPPDQTPPDKPSQRDSKKRVSQNLTRGDKTVYKHNKDPVYLSRVYGHKQGMREKKEEVSKPVKTSVSSNPKSSEGDIGRVYKQIEKIQHQLAQLSAVRQTETSHPIPPPPPHHHPVVAANTGIQPHPHTVAQIGLGPPYITASKKKQTARLMRPPRLIPSPHTPPPAPPEETKHPPHFITCDNAQVQTSFLTAVTPIASRVSSTHSSPHKTIEPSHKDIRTHHTHTQTQTITPIPVEIQVDIIQPSPTLTHSTEDVISHDNGDDIEEGSQLLEQMISLQADSGREHSPLPPSPHPTVPQDPHEVLREQELGRRYLLERVQQMLVEKASVSISDQVTLSEARRKQDEGRKVAAAVENAIKREMLSCIRSARQELREKGEEAPESEQEEVYSMSFVSETDEPSLHSSPNTSPPTSPQASPLTSPVPSPTSPIPIADFPPFDEHSTPYSPTFKTPPVPPLPRPLSATPDHPPSPRTRAFFQRSPPLYRPPSPESAAVTPSPPSPVHIGIQTSQLTLPHAGVQTDLDTSFSPISEEIQCDMNNTLTNLPPSSPSPPLLSPPAHEVVPPQLNSTANTPILPPVNHSIQCDLQRTPTPFHSRAVHAEVQCDLREATPFQLPPPLDPISTLPSFSTSEFTPTDTSRLTDTDYPSYVSEGEYVPPRGKRHIHAPSSVISVGEIPPLQLSPAVEAALSLKSMGPDPPDLSDTLSPGEYRPTHLHKTPVRLFHQSEGIFSSEGSNPSPSSSPIPPAPLSQSISPGEAAADVTPSDSDHLSRSVTLSIAFSSPSNKTTTRHRDGVDVFDVSALEGLSVPMGWDPSEMSMERLTPDMPSDRTRPLSRVHAPVDSQPNQLEPLQLDKSSNSTTCDIHSLASLSKEAIHS